MASMHFTIEAPRKGDQSGIAIISSSGLKVGMRVEIKGRRKKKMSGVIKRVFSKE